MTVVLSRRTLNRTLLRRQLLAERVDLPPAEAVAHLVALQAQMPNWPYVGLWARLRDFRPGQLDALLSERTVVRSTLLRITQHLTHADDFGWLRPTVQPAVDRAVRAAYLADAVDGLDLPELARTGQDLLAGRTLGRRELGRGLVERYPGRNGARLASAVEVMIPLVHPAPYGVWGAWGHRPQTPLALAEDWLGRPMGSPRPDLMVHRYLAAFGPASVADLQAWSGLTRLREVVDELRPGLRALRAESGAEVFDLPDAVIDDGERPVPVRFLPAFDNALLGYRDRTRVISEPDRRRIAPSASAGVATFLVDGFVAGTWTVNGGGVAVSPFRPLTDADAAAVAEEAERLLAFVAPEGADAAVTFTPAE